VETVEPSEPEWVIDEAGKSVKAHRRAFLVLSLVLGLADSAAAFDDQDFCTVAKQMASASERDIGTWIDRTTRNAGMQVACEAKAVEFLRFTYETASTMDSAWKARAGEGWNGWVCASALWREAVLNGWQVTLSIWSAERHSLSFAARCR
jgi:hypothetical protein